MARTLTEKKVLRMLGIPDFRHMTKDKIIQFASMIPKMDPDVAKKALEQFPEFAKSATEIVSYYKDILYKGIDENTASVNSFYATCDAIIDTLRDQLQDESMTLENKTLIINKMVELAQMKGNKDTENKKFILSIVKYTTAGFAIIVGTVAAVLGAQTNISTSTIDDDTSIDNDDDEEEDLDIVDYQ